MLQAHAAGPAHWALALREVLTGALSLARRRRKSGCLLCAFLQRKVSPVLAANSGVGGFQPHPPASPGCRAAAAGAARETNKASGCFSVLLPPSLPPPHPPPTHNTCILHGSLLSPEKQHKTSRVAMHHRKPANRKR